MQSLHSFCTQHGLAKTSVKRWLNANGYDTSGGLSEAAINAALGHFKPAPVAAVEAELVEPAEAQMVVHNPAAQGIVPITIQSLTVNITQANTQALDLETARFQAISGEGLSSIGKYLQADLVTTVKHAIAQNRHAVAGLNAQAAVGLANSLGKPADEDLPPAA